MKMTHHAEARAQQRGIPYAAMDAILAYGRRRRHNGADVYFLDKKSRGRLVRELGDKVYSRLERSLNSYLVVGDDGAVITAAHRLTPGGKTGVRRDENHRNIGVHIHHVVEQGHAVHPRHGDIGQNDIGLMHRNSLKSLYTVLRGIRRIPLLLEELFH